MNCIACVDLKSCVPRDVSAARKNVINVFSEAANLPASLLEDRLEAALSWREKASEYSDTSELMAHVVALNILHDAIASNQSLERRTSAFSDKHIRAGRSLAVDAAALAISEGNSELAVKLLEQGRGIIFRQFGQLRAASTADDILLVVPELAERFASLSAELEALAVADPKRSSLGPTGRGFEMALYRYVC